MNQKEDDTMLAIYSRLNTVFRDVFDDNSITVTADSISSDIEEWDSIHHISLINAVEEEFKMRFTMKQVSSMKNVGEMVEIIRKAAGI